MLPYEHWICQVHLSLPKWLNQWKGYAFAIIFNGSFQRIRVCGTEVLLILLLIPMSINRTRGMNDKLRRKVKPRRNNGFTSLNRCEFIAGSLKLCRSRRFKYRSADPAAHLQFGVDCVDDGVNFQLRYILADNSKWHLNSTCIFY